MICTSAVRDTDDRLCLRPNVSEKIKLIPGRGFPCWATFAFDMTSIVCSTFCLIEKCQYSITSWTSFSHMKPKEVRGPTGPPPYYLPINKLETIFWCQIPPSFNWCFFNLQLVTTFGSLTQLLVQMTRFPPPPPPFLQVFSKVRLRAQFPQVSQEVRHLQPGL